MSREHVTRRILFSGRVQGVGFRWTTNRIASKFSVTGFVRNLANGQVELIVQGQTAVVADFLQEIQSAMSGNIDNVQDEVITSVEAFTTFEVRR